MQKIFKNANILNLETGDLQNADILVENDKIVGVGSHQNCDAEVIDLAGDFVLPNFVNAYCNSAKAYEQTYGKTHTQNDGLLTNIKNLMLAKNILAGAICNDVAQNGACVLENVDMCSENELSDLSEKVATEKRKLFMKVGQTLDELGTIDKEYKKPLSQVLEDFGFLDRKPIVVGGNCFEKDDLALFSQYDCDFCLTVGDDGKLGRRPTNVVSLLHHDFCVGIGSGNSFEIDFFGFMRQILMTQRGLFEDKNILTEQDVLKMAISNGAQILGINCEVKEGERANFMVIKNTPTLYDNAISSIVWEKSKRDVVMTVLNGEIVQKNGEILMKNLAKYDKIIEKIVEEQSMS